MVSDTMASFEGGAFCSDGIMIKGATVNLAWSALYAGNDITPVRPIIRRVQEEIADGGRAAPPIGVAAMQVSFAHAYQAERVLRAEQVLLGIYGLDMATFNSQAIELFGESGAAIMRERIERVEFDCAFLVCGFDDYIYPHVFTVSNPGIVNDYDVPGYWAIGSGALNALSALAMSEHSRFCSLETTIYNACVAKFMAESAVGVGKTTVVLVQWPDLRSVFMSTEEIKAVRKDWERYGKPRKAVAAGVRLKRWLESESTSPAEKSLEHVKREPSSS
jgi:hypothetical protein